MISDPALEGKGPLLTPGQTARLFGVDRRTIARWGDRGELTIVKTIAGQRRFRQSEVERVLQGATRLRVDDPA
ncbi:MAG: binding domain protein excisionase family [Frankiales bacterium]|nr:binding domain protein excisionase family [Frankiales bacterium]